MSILIAGTVHLPAGDREKALGGKPPVSLKRPAPNRAACTMSGRRDPTSDTRLYVFEKWASVEDLAAHLAGPYYMNMLTSLGKYGVSDTDVSKYRIDLEEPVYDPEGRPRADFFTE